MRTKINKITNVCETCLQNKYKRNPYKIQFSGPLLVKRPFDVIHMDTFGFENAKCLTIIDLFQVRTSLLLKRLIRYIYFK